MLSPEYAKKVTRNRNHIELAYQASQKSIVMLKNDGTLPLDESERIAVLGSLAKHPKLGGYSTWEIEVNSLIDTMINADYIEANGVSVEQKFSLIESEFFKSMSEDGIIPGITGFYKDNKVFCFEPVIIRNDGCINFDWSESPAAEHEKFQVGKEFSVEWRGLIEVPRSGQYTFCIEANGGIKLEIDSELLIDRFFDTVSDRQMAMYYLERGKHYPIVLGFSTSGSSPKIKFTWDYSENQDQRIPDYQQILKNYRTVVIVAGVTEGEGSDRSNLDLTQSMEKLICDVAEIRKKVIVVIYAGSAVTMMKWQDKVSGIFHVWYPEEAGGKAIADVLYGRYNPAGRLPITFPQHVAQIPLCYNEEPRGRNSGYNDITDKPLYPFGFGLSYSTFVYDNVLLEKSYISIGESTSLKVNVTNIGKMDGDEVIQLYIHDVFSSVATPKLELKDFKRVHIKRGETKTVEFLLTPKMLQLLGEDLIWVIEHRHSKLLNIGLK
jgi:beta-glucosidase